MTPKRLVEEIERRNRSIKALSDALARTISGKHDMMDEWIVKGARSLLDEPVPEADPGPEPPSPTEVHEMACDAFLSEEGRDILEGILVALIRKDNPDKDVWVRRDYTDAAKKLPPEAWHHYLKLVEITGVK